MDLLRSLMFVPGSKQRMLDKALGLANLDVALFDIEDGVVPAEKPLAREQIWATLAQANGSHGPARFVRIKHGEPGADRIEADLAAVILPSLDGLLIPKVECTEQLAHIDQHEQQCGLPPGSVKLIAAIETARGLLNAARTAAASPRLLGLMFGAEDYALDLGLPSNRQAEARQLIYARSALVNAAASAHIGAFDGVWPTSTTSRAPSATPSRPHGLASAARPLFTPARSTSSTASSHPPKPSSTTPARWWRLSKRPSSAAMAPWPSAASCWIFRSSSAPDARCASPLSCSHTES